MISVDELAEVFLSQVVARHGVPERLISDRDPQFVPRFLSSLMSALGAEVALCTAYHPQTDGQSERQHRQVEQILRCFVSPRQTDWDLLLPCAEFVLNCIRSSATGHSPAFILYGREPTLPLEATVQNVVDCKAPMVSECAARMQEVAASVRTMLQNAAEQMAQTVNKRQCPGTIIMESIAWLSIEHLKLPAGLTRKFAPRFVGPFPVEAVAPVSFRLTLPAEWRIHLFFMYLN